MLVAVAALACRDADTAGDGSPAADAKTEQARAPRAPERGAAAPTPAERPEEQPASSMDTTAADVPGGDTIAFKAAGADSLVALLAGSPSLGPANAAVVLVEFSDFECPFCTRARDTMHRFMRDRPDVRLIYAHSPIRELHPRAVLAAEASVEAQRQGKFWEYHDALFAHGPPLERETLIEIADDVSLDVGAMRTALEKRTHRERVAREMKLADGLGITGTPTFFINGYRLVGAHPYETFVTVYNLLLRAGRRDALADAGGARR